MSPVKEEKAVAAATVIQQRVEECAKALRARDIDGVMSLYTSDIVSFDVGPPLRYSGSDHKRRAWQQFFAAFTGPIAYDFHEVDVKMQGELAVVHSLNHVTGTLGSGQVANLWVRWTACLRRIDDVWLIVHDHVSVPADVEHGRAVLNLAP